MKAILTSALASLGLAVTPIGAQAAAEDVDYSKAMACSSLYTVLAASVEGEPEFEEFVDHSARWLIIATFRDGRQDVIAERELQGWVDALLGQLNARDNDQARVALLYQQIDVCEVLYEKIADEFDSIIL